jgi:uncharacterized repeat protein (TIGR01451 family)
VTPPTSLTGANATGWTLATISSFNLPALSVFAMQWTSLDGVIAARSAFNPNAVERGGTGGINDYVITATAAYTVTPLDATKVLITSSESSTAGQAATIGEVLSYRLYITMAETTNPNLQISFQDVLPSNLQFVTGTIALSSRTGQSASRAAPFRRRIA